LLVVVSNDLASAQGGVKALAQIFGCRGKATAEKQDEERGFSHRFIITHSRAGTSTLRTRSITKYVPSSENMSKVGAVMADLTTEI